MERSISLTLLGHAWSTSFFLAVKLKKVGLFSHVRIHFPTWQPWLDGSSWSTYPKTCPRTSQNSSASKQKTQTWSPVVDHHFRHHFRHLNCHHLGPIQDLPLTTAAAVAWDPKTPWRAAGPLRGHGCSQRCAEFYSNQLHVIYHTCVYISIYIYMYILIITMVLY